ncbi:MAG: hypothetical protein KDC98_24665 [Planctomycetes bacterium]|nr:hypothetical protein [Planctomycetota bacterium]
MDILLRIVVTGAIWMVILGLAVWIARQRVGRRSPDDALLVCYPSARLVAPFILGVVGFVPAAILSAWVAAWSGVGVFGAAALVASFCWWRISGALAFLPDRLVRVGPFGRRIEVPWAGATYRVHWFRGACVVRNGRSAISVSGVWVPQAELLERLRVHLDDATWHDAERALRGDWTGAFDGPPSSAQSSGRARERQSEE